MILRVQDEFHITKLIIEKNQELNDSLFQLFRIINLNNFNLIFFFFAMKIAKNYFYLKGSVII